MCRGYSRHQTRTFDRRITAVGVHDQRCGQQIVSLDCGNKTRGTIAMRVNDINVMLANDLTKLPQSMLVPSGAAVELENRNSAINSVSQSQVISGNAYRR